MPFWTNEPITKKLTTDDSGFIELGRLYDINQLTVLAPPEITYQSLNGSWRISQQANEVSYPSEISCREGDSINLPVPSNFTQADFSLIRQGTGPEANETARFKIEAGRLIGKID